MRELIIDPTNPRQLLVGADGRRLVDVCDDCCIGPLATIPATATLAVGGMVFCAGAVECGLAFGPPCGAGAAALTRYSASGAPNGSWALQRATAAPGAAALTYLATYLAPNPFGFFEFQRSQCFTFAVPDPIIWSPVTATRFRWGAELFWTRPTASAGWCLALVRPLVYGETLLGNGSYGPPGASGYFTNFWQCVNPPEPLGAIVNGNAAPACVLDCATWSGMGGGTALLTLNP